MDAPNEVDALVEGVLAGDRRAVARAISLVEDGRPELEALSAGIYGATGRTVTVGITGAPGVGKSTLAGALVGVARAHDRRVAVLAIDPTSPYTGGALLGDRVRMQEHATDPDVFIRSMATRGHLGGMALAAPEGVRILDAAGYDLVMIETVGVGQAEVEVAAATDTTIVILAPGLGDAVQMAKAGILEVADVFVVNKADRDGAGQVARELRQMLHLGERRDHDPPVLRVAASLGDGVDEVWEAIDEHGAWAEASGGGGGAARGRRPRACSRRSSRWPPSGSSWPRSPSSTPTTTWPPTSPSDASTRTGPPRRSSVVRPRSGYARRRTHGRDETSHERRTRR
jgi:LAO/AO transport system kinase